MPIPVDSAEAAELREREEEREESERLDREARARAATADQRVCAELCHGSGWAGEDDEGRPRPCPVHKPTLLAVACWTCGQRYQACATRQAERRGPCCAHCDHRRRGGGS